MNFLLFIFNFFLLFATVMSKDPLIDSIGTPVVKCWGDGSCNRWILCNKNWGCSKDCMGCAICGEGNSEFSETKYGEECRGSGRCKDRVIICHSLTYCTYSKSGCPACSPYSS